MAPLDISNYEQKTHASPIHASMLKGPGWVRPTESWGPSLVRWFADPLPKKPVSDMYRIMLGIKQHPIQQ
jgi:hypothetical protein